MDHVGLPGMIRAARIAREAGIPVVAAVVITRSAEGAWCLTAEEPDTVFHQPGFRVREVDTNGCGDVFHGVYAAGLSEGMAAAERIRFAAAVAAQKTTRPGGQKGIPMRVEVDRFCAERSSEALRRPA